MNWVIPWLIRWACRAGTRDFGPALAALVGPVQNIFFRTVHYFTSFVPIIQHAGQAVVPHCLSLTMYLWSMVMEHFQGTGPGHAISDLAPYQNHSFFSDLNLKPKLMKMGGGEWDRMDTM
jgi:hypothetical protein